jgi:STE24 endopeptidase
MNWKLFVILAVVLEAVFQFALHLVQRRSAANPTPANVADVYDPQEYDRWKNYNADNCRLGMVSTGINLAVNLILLFTNAYAAIAGWFPEGDYVQMIVVIVANALISTLVNVGLQYVDTMIIEQKYGFNRSTFKTFVIDQIRNLLLGIGLSLVLGGLMTFLYQTMGDWMLLLFTAAVFGITLLISFLYPIFSRIGNKFEPLEDGELKDKLMALLDKHNYKVKAIEVMDASRRTTKLNAYFAGFGKMKTIVIYDNMLNAMATDEIVAVFSHELGHGLHKDVLKMQIMNLGNLLLMAVIVWLTVRTPEMHTAFGFAGVNYGFSYILTGVGLSLIQPITGILTNAYSRKAEYRADRQAVQEGYGQGLITALKKLGKENFSHLAPAKLLVVLNYSHPPLSERIDAIEKAMK